MAREIQLMVHVTELFLHFESSDYSYVNYKCSLTDRIVRSVIGIEHRTAIYLIFLAMYINFFILIKNIVNVSQFFKSFQEWEIERL